MEVDEDLDPLPEVRGKEDRRDEEEGEKYEESFQVEGEVAPEAPDRLGDESDHEEIGPHHRDRERVVYHVPGDEDLHVEKPVPEEENAADAAMNTTKGTGRRISRRRGRGLRGSAEHQNEDSADSQDQVLDPKLLPGIRPQRQFEIRQDDGEDQAEDREEERNRGNPAWRVEGPSARPPERGRDCDEAPRKSDLAGSSVSAALPNSRLNRSHGPGAGSPGEGYLRQKAGPVATDAASGRISILTALRRGERCIEEEAAIQRGPWFGTDEAAQHTAPRRLTAGIVRKRRGIIGDPGEAAVGRPNRRERNLSPAGSGVLSAGINGLHRFPFRISGMVYNKNNAVRQKATHLKSNRRECEMGTGQMRWI
jgi:hypothetical protein